MDVEIEAKFLRTSDLPITELFQREQKLEDDNVESHRSSLVGWLNQVNHDIRDLLKIKPPFPEKEVISVHYLLEIKEDLETVFIEEVKMEQPRYLIREATIGIRIVWFNAIIDFVNSHYK